MKLDRHLTALQAHWKRHKAFPSMAKLTVVLGMASTGGVFKVLGRLTDAGYLERVAGRIAPTKRFFERPVLDTVRAGQPQTASQGEMYDTLSIEDYLVEHPERTSYCHIKGDSMKDAGMLEGDIAVVEGNTLPVPGNIVAAVVDGQITVKFLQMDADGAWFLQPGNLVYKDTIQTGPLEVRGVVVGLIRRFDRRPKALAVDAPAPTEEP